MSTPEPKQHSPSILSAAYQAALEREAQFVSKGDRIVGRKIGFTDRRLWTQLGVSAPMWGAMYDNTVVDAGSQPFRYSLAHLNGPKIEPEIAMHFHKAPPPKASATELLECIDWVAHAFELVRTPANGKPPTAPEAIAAGAMHGALLLAERVAIADLGDDVADQLSQIIVDLHCDGELKESGKSANVLGNPLNAIIQLIEGLQREGMPAIEAGAIISTGTMTTAYPIAPGQRWTSTLLGTTLPGLDVTFY
ncbi:MAG: decarboxylase [Burkholderiaceae bacterium]